MLRAPSVPFSQRREETGEEFSQLLRHLPPFKATPFTHLGTAIERLSSMAVKLVSIAIEKPEEVNLILGQAHFIKTIEDLHEALVTAVPGIAFGLAFCESSGPCVVGGSGTDPELAALARTNAEAIGAGHSFLVLLRGAHPINVLPVIRQVPEVCGIYCATANPVEVVVAKTAKGRGIVGVVDGARPRGVETERDVAARKALLGQLG